MTLSQTLRAATIAGLLLLPVPDRLAACAFHTTLPEMTLSGDIAGSLELISARPAADDPFRFEPVEVLRGEASGQSPPFIVDSVTRARLLRNPDEAVLFARAADGTWTRLLVLDAITRPIVDLMVARADTWAAPSGAEERRDTFAALLAHPDARLRQIALRELDALPYDVLRRGTYPVKAEALLDGIASIDQMPFAPIRILLLGLDDGETAREAIARRLAMMATLRVETNLGPWVTAAIESGGQDAVAAVERLYLGSSDRLSQPQLTDLVRALSEQSAKGDPALRSALDGALRRLVSLRPDAAPLIAQAFGTNADYSQADLIRDLVAARAFSDIAGLMAAAAYINSARAAEGGAVVRMGQLQASTSE